MKRPPAQTRHSLLASATLAPRSAAGWGWSGPMVLAPMEPVAPSTVTLRISPAGARCSDCATGIPSFISSPYQETACRRFDTVVGQADQRGEHGRHHETVKPIH